MTSFISLYIILGTACVILLSAVPEISVCGPVGSTAVLLCELTSVDPDTLHIKWEIKFETQYKNVFERKGVALYQGEGYEGRVDIPVEELRKGNCSLVLRNLTLTDTGVYSSYQAVRRSKRSVTKVEISRVNLTVHDKTEERMDDNSDSPENTGWNHHYLWILVLPVLVLLGLCVWHLKRRNICSHL